MKYAAVLLASLLWPALTHAADPYACDGSSRYQAQWKGKEECPPELPAGASCEAIREKVAEHGRARAVAWARREGYSWRQINEARKCLR